jgi:2-dehydro-3-deoxyphosphogluconate aldolase/(4S)-4-hydroxy-2-oxoglutarate aldolase
MANVEGFIVGAGTVLRPGDAEVAVAAGASYLVSPGFDERLTRFAIDIGVPFIPGVASATEVQHALSSGLTHLKLFPAGLLGGLDLINAFAGPFPESRFMPSGGVSAANVTDYLSSDSVFAVSGSWMVPTHAVMTNDMETISRLTSQAAAARGR